QHDVRIEVPCELDRLEPVLGLRDDFQVLARLEDHPEAAADERLVVGDEDANAAHEPVSWSSGKRARTRKPPARPAAPASTSPPSSAARSRIPISPWPPFGAIAAAPMPSSSICSSMLEPLRRTVTSAAEARACLSVFVSASWTIR